MARYYSDWGGFPQYVPVAEKRANAQKVIAKLQKKGRAVSPVALEGRAIATTFWGKAWCKNLEGYADYQSRLGRGRSYVRNGCVVDLQVAPGRVTALVNGTELYDATVDITALPPARWAAVVKECAGRIDSLVELVQGKLSKAVMEVITRPGTGLFPAPAEIRMRCSCPDGAYMCKHLAAVLYGVGARLDVAPELFFTLRRVDPADLIAQASAPALSSKAPAGDKVLRGEDLSALFGIELTPAAKPSPKAAAAVARTVGARARKAAAPVATAAKPATKKPASTKKPSTKKPASTKKPSTKKPASTKKPSTKKPRA